MDVFGEVSLEYETPGTYHVFYPGEEPEIDATVDLKNGEMYFSGSREQEEHLDYLDDVLEGLYLEEGESVDEESIRQEVEEHAGY